MFPLVYLWRVLLHKNNTFMQADGFTCEAIERCESRKNCSNACYVINGTDICQCPRGYSLNADGLNCDDIDECDTNDHVCEAINKVKAVMCLLLYTFFVVCCVLW